MFWVVWISCLPVVNSHWLWLTHWLRSLQMMSIFLTWKFLAPRKLWNCGIISILHKTTDPSVVEQTKPRGSSESTGRKNIGWFSPALRGEDSLILTCLLVMVISTNLCGKTVVKPMTVELVGISTSEWHCCNYLGTTCSIDVLLQISCFEK